MKIIFASSSSSSTVVFFVVFLLFPIVIVKADVNSLEQHRNAALLFKTMTNNEKYNKSILPASVGCEGDSSHCPYVVHARMFLLRIQELLDDKETLVSTVRLQLSWLDTAIAWNPDDYQGVTGISIPGGSLWQPDLQFANSLEDMYALTKATDFSFRIEYDGRVWYHPTGTITTRCKMDLTYYPFDYQYVISQVGFPFFIYFCLK